LGRIRVLPDPLINRIAAGEVVERPASVVKELVENSLDAGARSIEVALQGGGRQGVRVTDDGHGMDRDDALLAIERHATSKLSSAAELEAIPTLGFRGEALASIAAVSRMVLETSERDGTGTEIQVRGGRIESVREVGLARGTTVQVDRLFHNTPARRKFLRSDSTELGHALRWLVRHALSAPAIGFRLQHGDRRLVEAPPAGSALERIAQLFGHALVGRLLPFEADVAGVRVHGYAGRPVEGRPGRDAQHFFVNGRTVQDRVLAHAVSQAYADAMPRGRHPVLFLFVEVDPRAVDVNVHPQKTEVRFHQPSGIHDLVQRAVAAAFSGSAALPELADLRPRSDAASAAGIRRAALGFLEAHEPSPAPYRATQPLRGPVAATPLEKRAPAAALGQIRDSYIVAADADGLVVIDQHAAHERVLFERYLAQADEGSVEVQRLMFPATFEVSAQEQVVLEEQREEFHRLGFLAEPFGERIVRLDGVPAVAGALAPEPLFRELLGEADRHRSPVTGLGELRRRLVTTAACQAAIKVNHPLTREGMEGLLRDLYHADNPTTCPHGRPILFRVSVDEIERAFRRR
jgi:DNA mismatch repair protein MutL